MIVNIFAVEKPRKMKNVMDDIKYVYDYCTSSKVYSVKYTRHFRLATNSRKFSYEKMCN